MTTAETIASHARSHATTVSRAEREDRSHEVPGEPFIDHASDGAAVPVTYGASERPPRGDYASAGPDYVCDQHWARYTDAEHDRYRRLYADRIARLPGLACDEFIDALDAMRAADRIPDLAAISIPLRKATGWEVVAVPGLISEHAFFALLAARRFPVTTWLRAEDEFDYIVEPDIFHDFFGHVPLLFNPMFGDYMQAFGLGGLKAESLGGLEYLARLYWYTVEFGLIATPKGLRIYGAGIVSSGSEPEHALFCHEPQRVAFALERTMRSQYKIDTFQSTYFVIESFAELFDATAPDFTPIYRRLNELPAHPAGVVLPGERLYPARARDGGITSPSDSTR